MHVLTEPEEATPYRELLGGGWLVRHHETWGADGKGGLLGERIEVDWRRVGAAALAVGGTLLVPLLVGAQARKAWSQ